MSIRERILAFQVLTAFAVIAMAATVVLDLRSRNAQFERAQYARQQLAATSQLATSANRYSEQIAELLLIGDPERPDFDSARSQVAQAFADLRAATLREAASLGDAEEREEERIEIERLDRAQGLFRDIDRAVERLLLIDRQGQRDEAIALFRAEIENRLDADFERLIAAALADEREEVRETEAEIARLTRVLTAWTLGVLGVLLALTLLAGTLLARSLHRPIEALVGGTLAIERGDFDHRINSRGRDELGVLSRRFDDMADELGRQRALLVGARAELERQVAGRTSELEEANRQLIVADEQRVRFLADISHELRTPLTALRGEAEVALRGQAKSEATYREALSTVVARAIDMARLIEDLLFLARSEADEIRFDVRRLDLRELAADAVRDAEALARERGIRIQHASGPPGPVFTRGDPRRLKQAMLIALDNAIKYSDPGAQVAVSVETTTDAAQIAIVDQGAGLAPDDIPRAFERFHRGANARERWEGGSGLGLPIARWIVEKHGGRIDLFSVLGEGTQVRLHLPIRG